MGWVSGFVHLIENVSSCPFFLDLNQDIDQDQDLSLTIYGNWNIPDNQSYWSNIDSQACEDGLGKH